MMHEARKASSSSAYTMKSMFIANALVANFSLVQLAVSSRTAGRSFHNPPNTHINAQINTHRVRSEVYNKHHGSRSRSIPAL